MMAFAAKVVLQNTLGSFFTEDKEVLSFKHHFDQAWSELEHRLTDPTIPPDDSSRGKAFSEAVKGMRGTLHRALQHREKHRIGDQELLALDHIIAAHKDEDARIADCITYVAEGIPTTGNLLSWCLYFLASHPAVQEKVFEEVHHELRSANDLTPHNISQLK
nr:hypothetical protein BaRGS_003193 [Batillaria attramentaria]